VLYTPISDQKISPADESARLAARPSHYEETDRTSTAAWLRRLLFCALSGQGLAVHPLEWWHWSYGDAVWSAANQQPMAYLQAGDSPLMSRG
jgi:D-alanyl-D-alanine dipeptidase